MKHTTLFEAIIRHAKSGFEREDWHGLQEDTAKRLGLYRRIVDLVEAAVRDLLADRLRNKLIWAGMKAVYSGLIIDDDEFCILPDYNFRRLSSASSYEDELAAEPWFHINEGDIFPEEFAHFVGLSGDLKASFARYTSDLFAAVYWRQTQERLRRGELLHICPYERSQRLHALPAASAEAKLSRLPCQPMAVR